MSRPTLERLGRRMRCAPFLALALLLGVPVAGAKSRKVACPGGRFIVDARHSPLLPSPAPPRLEVLTINPTATIAVASGCEGGTAKLVATKKGTRVVGRWREGSCRGVKGVVHLTAKIGADCRTIRGTLRGKKLKRKFAATRSSCGDGTLDPGALETCDTPGSGRCDATCGGGVRLEGPAGGRLLDALRAFGTRQGVPPEEIETEASGRRVARTILEVALDPNATVGQVNALLDAIDGRIVSMLAGVPIVVVRFPDPGSLTGLHAVLARVAATAGVRFVNEGGFSEPDALPPNFDLPPPEDPVPKLGHHLAVRAHAAWNAREAINVGDEPLVVVADVFGEGPPADLGALLVPDDFATGINFVHGYAVLGILAGDFGGAATDRGLVTGMFPAEGFPRAVPIRAVDRGAGLTDAQTQNEIVQQLIDDGGRAVLNTSYGLSAVCTPVGANCIDPAVARQHAITWIEKVRGPDLERRFVHLTSAGNVEDSRPNIVDALTNSTFASAALFGDLTTSTGTAVARLTNTLVIENARGEDPPSFTARCLSDRSYVGGDLSAVGTNVWTFDGPDTLYGASFHPGGTSDAAPQVAGLAAYVWSIAPSLTAQQVVGLLRDTSRELPDPDGPGCSRRLVAVTPRRVIDAYDAVLALDAAAPPTRDNSPVRRAILDLDSNTSFDESDIAAFKGEFFDPITGDIPEPTSRDFGRQDLNGDGFTGGTRTARFDLDRTGSTQFGASTITRVTIEIGDTERTFDESSVTDDDILCYYAYSALYTGAPTARDGILLDVCAGDCGFPKNVLPPGSYALTCGSCTVAGTVLSCNCRRIDGSFQDTEIDFSTCKRDKDLANIDGVLKCAPCD